MNINITNQCLKNIMKVATAKKEIESISQSKKNDFRDIEIKLSYSPLLSPKDDVYPYWKLEMREEENFKAIFINGTNLKDVKNIFNRFTSQGEKETYLLDNFINY